MFNITIKKSCLLILNFSILTDFLSPLEEAMMIVDQVHSFLFVGDVESHWLPWEVLRSTSYGSIARIAKIKAIEDQLGVFPDGSQVPLTLRQRLFFGTSLGKLEYKISKCQRKSKDIVQAVRSLKAWESDIKDTKLIRCFILECLAPFKRYTLQHSNAVYEESILEKTTWPIYALSWILVGGSLCFFMYWIFAWAVVTGGTNLSIWGAIFVTGAASDIVLVQVTKIFLLYYIPSKAMQPQLVRIRSVLADIIMDYINRHDPAVQEQEEEESDDDDIRVVQHLSAACRAARSSELKSLPAAWLLRQVKIIKFCDDTTVLRTLCNLSDTFR